MSERTAILVATFTGVLLVAQTPTPPQASPVTEPSKPPAPHLLPPAKEGEMPCDSKDHQPVIVGPSTREAILAHRPIFKSNMEKTVLGPDLLKRWQELATPCVLVVAFGSWCGDTQRELPGLLALMGEDNPFVKVHLVGVYRDKKVPAHGWPMGLEEQPVLKVPTIWLYALQPGGGYKLSGSIVENPPKKGQSMAEAIVELLEQAQ